MKPQEVRREAKPGQNRLPMHSFDCPNLGILDNSACPEAWHIAGTYVGGRFSAAATALKVARSFHCSVRGD